MAGHSSVTYKYALNNLLEGRLKASSKLNLSINLLFLLIAAFSSDTTYSVPGIASHTFMFSQNSDFPQKMVYKQKKSKLKPFTE